MINTDPKAIVKNFRATLSCEIIPKSSEDEARDFNRLVLMLDVLAEIPVGSKQFCDKYAAIKYWISDSCSWTEPFLAECNKFKKQMKKALKSTATTQM